MITLWALVAILCSGCVLAGSALAIGTMRRAWARPGSLVGLARAIFA